MNEGSATICTLLDQLYDICEWYFENDKESRVDCLIQQIESRLTPTDYYYKGKLLNRKESFSIDAEVLLTKAVKLDPFNADAWNCMALNQWKKGDKHMARICYERSLEVTLNKHALRDLSMLLRQSPSCSHDEILMSVEYANQAVQLDLTDHKSWYLLGNAYTSRYFSYSSDIKDLSKAMSAYQKAESNGGTLNPDLYYNRGMVHQYQLDYEAALAAYHTSFCIDKTLVDGKRLFQVLNQYIALINKSISELIVTLISNPRQITSFASTLAAPVITTQHLKQGSNKKVTFSVKIVADVMHTSPPYNYICMDAEGKLIMICFYNIAEGVRFFRVDQVITIKSPLVMDKKPVPAHRTWNQLRADLLLVQVFDLKSIVVDGKPFPEQLIAPTVLKSILLLGSEDQGTKVS